MSVTEFNPYRKTSTPKRAYEEVRRQRRILAVNPNAEPVDLEPKVWLPIEPFRDWLESLIAEHGHDVVCERTGLACREMWRLRHDQKNVQLDMVDRCACMWGHPWLLRELYEFVYDLPELDDEDVGVAA